MAKDERVSQVTEEFDPLETIEETNKVLSEDIDEVSDFSIDDFTDTDHIDQLEMTVPYKGKRKRVIVRVASVIDRLIDDAQRDLEPPTVKAYKAAISEAAKVSTKELQKTILEQKELLSEEDWEEIQEYNQRKNDALLVKYIILPNVVWDADWDKKDSTQVPVSKVPSYLRESLLEAYNKANNPTESLEVQFR